MQAPKPLKKCLLFSWWVIALRLSWPLSAQHLPAGTMLEARLSVATGSRISHAGDRIEATIIAPASVGGRIVIPAGSVLSGAIGNVTPIGLGLKHTTAGIGYNFDALSVENGEPISIESEVVEVETAKERVNITGTVHRIHPIASLSSALDFVTVSLLCVTPPIGAPLRATKSLVAPPANLEIYFPAGTEMILRLTAQRTFPLLTYSHFLSSHSRPEKLLEFKICLIIPLDSPARALIPLTR